MDEHREAKHVCISHDELVNSVAELTVSMAGLGADLKWLIVIGKWGVGLMGTSVVLLLPMLVTVGTYLLKIDNRVTSLEIQVQQVMNRVNIHGR